MQWIRVPVFRCGHFTSPALASIALLVALIGELHAQGKGMRLWNLTTSTISGFQLSPAGKNEWGPNQTRLTELRGEPHDGMIGRHLGL